MPSSINHPHRCSANWIWDNPSHVPYRNDPLLIDKRNVHSRLGQRLMPIQQNCDLGQHANDVEKLIEFFNLADIFPKDAGVKRDMTKDFFWDRVRRPNKVGLDETAKKENIELHSGTRELLKRMSKHAFDRSYFQEFESDGEDDGSVQSMASTCYGSIVEGDINHDPVIEPGQDETLEQLKEAKTSHPEKIEDALKHLGNVKKKICR